jgi:DNA modification methylase
MKTSHSVYYENASSMRNLDDESIDLVLTSPPYPMIEMWDESFGRQDPQIDRQLKMGNDGEAFEAMHAILDRIWQEVHRVLKPGGIACINIGDATRKLKSDFKLYPNHSRILARFTALGMSVLPAILWRKQTNAPNKFMGSGMMPPGAYVTLEHEYVLLLRKGSLRVFASPDAKQNRKESAYFWEERNLWFSDVWMDIKGTVQSLSDPTVRKRSAAFPFDLAYRLINMFSVKGDTVLDPFLGTATTMQAAMTAARNSVGFEIESQLQRSVLPDPAALVTHARKTIAARIAGHRRFVEEREAAKAPLKHTNRHYGFPVVTSQERELFLNELIAIETVGPDAFQAVHGDIADHQAKGIADQRGDSPPLAQADKKQMSLWP